MKKWIETLEKLISWIEKDRDALQQKQDSYEEDCDAFDPEDEFSIEPEEVNNQGQIDQLDEVLGLLERAKELLP